jgi:LDH2 family malate/lactate/ureidoglycolate dehydrogenase
MRDGSNYLDPDRPEAVRLSVGDAQALGEAALARIGYVADDACIITDQLIDNALCGYRFAGLPRILAIAREAKTRDTRVPVAVAHETPVCALVDGGNNVGYVAVYRGAEIAIAKATQTGVAAVGVYNSYFSGRNAYTSNASSMPDLSACTPPAARRISCRPAQPARLSAPTRSPSAFRRPMGRSFSTSGRLH